jgi:hypothetical protein
VLKKRRQELANKWAGSGILDGLNYGLNQNIAQLLESQANQLIGISSRGFEETISKPKVKETFLSKIKSFFISIWRKVFKNKNNVIINTTFNVAFPLIRQGFAQTIAFDLVSVQPMSAPSAQLFYMDGFPEREDVYTRIVIFEKYKPYVYRGTYATNTVNNNGDIIL